MDMDVLEKRPTILEALQDGPRTSAKLSFMTGLALSTVYQRLRVLEAGGKVRTSGGGKKGTRVYHKVNT